MREHIAWSLRYLAGMAGQHTARTNAAEGSASLRERRRIHEDTHAYLQTARMTDLADAQGVRRDEHGAEHTL